MLKIVNAITNELNKKIWNSPLQLLLGAIVLYTLTVAMGTTFACGSGNSDVLRSVFKCASGSMQAQGKIFIIIGLALASLCLGRAMSLVEKRRAGAE